MNRKWAERETVRREVLQRARHRCPLGHLASLEEPSPVRPTIAAWGEQTHAVLIYASPVSAYGIHDSGLRVGASGKSRSGSFWPVGEHLAQHSDLAAILGESAQDAAHRAIRLFVSDERLELLQAAVGAGTAVEHLAKAAIVLVEPTLLADRVDRDTLLRLSGKGHRAEGAATRIRTIGALNAVKLVAALHKSVTVPLVLAEAALEVRNAAAHVGLVDREELRAAVSGMCRTVDAMLAAVAADRNSFWGTNVGVADALIEEGRAAVEQIVEAKFASARSHLAQLTKGMPAELAAAFLAALSQKLVRSDYEEEVPCPVCGQRAWLICGVEEGDVEFDPDESGWAWVSRTAYPFEFDCSVCGLTLDELELAHLDMNQPVELESRDVDPADYYEPDEDLYRGR